MRDLTVGGSANPEAQDEQLGRWRSLRQCPERQGQAEGLVSKVESFRDDDARKRFHQHAPKFAEYGGARARTTRCVAAVTIQPIGEMGGVLCVRPAPCA